MKKRVRNLYFTWWGGPLSHRSIFWHFTILSGWYDLGRRVILALWPRWFPHNTEEDEDCVRE